jgi:hypothetical protein
MVVFSFLSCGKEFADADSHGTSVRLRQEALAGSFGIESSQRLLTADELSKLSPYQLKIMKNGIYARHGYSFKSQDMIDYFEKQEWYEPDPGYSESSLNAIERENLKLIKMVETGSLAAGTSQDRRSLIKTWGTRFAESMAGNLIETEYELFDIDGDRDLDAVAFYIYGMGGNIGANSCHLAVFENRDEVYVHLADAPAGELGESALTEIVNASKGTITCQTAVWIGDDPICCPSGTGTAMFKLDGSELVAIRGNVPARPGDELFGD